MKLVFKDMASKTDKDKAIPIFEHIFTPLSESPEIKVRCRYLKAGESMKFMSASPEGKAAIDFRALFSSQVVGIEGIEVEYGDGGKAHISTAEDFLNLPATDEIQRILTSVCTHLLNADVLTEEEIKN